MCTQCYPEMFVKSGGGIYPGGPTGELLSKTWLMHSMKYYMKCRTNDPDVCMITWVDLKKKVLRKQVGTERDL